MVSRDNKSGQSRGVNKRFFTQVIRDRDLSQRRVAKLMNIDQASLVRAFQGKRRFKTEETAKLARVLSIPLEEVLRNLDVDVSLMHARRNVAVTGYIASGRVEFGKAAGPRRVEAPPNESGVGVQALRYSDAGPLEGAYLYFRPTDGVPAEAVGKLCVCAIQGGEILLASPRQGSRRACYTLYDVSGRTLLEDVWLESASPIMWIKTG